MVRLLLRSSLQHYLKHPFQLLLSLLGIILGIAIVSAILITNRTALYSFEQTANGLAGSTTHRITSASSGVDEANYVSLKRQFMLPMAPVLVGHIELSGELFTVRGIDPLAELELQRQSPYQNLNLAPSIQSLQHGVFIEQASLERLALTLDQPLPIVVGGLNKTITLIGAYQSTNTLATENLLIGDIGYVQALLARQGFLDHIELRLDQQQAAALSNELPSTLQLVPQSALLDTMRNMTRGFQINLTAMSLLALLIGAFLIHNSMTFSVLRRRQLFALQRIVGFTARSLLLIILCEALLIGIIGAVTGALLGYAIALFLIELTTRTINDLYFVLHAQTLRFTLTEFALVVLFGIGTSALAALASAIEAQSISPLQARQRSGIEVKTRRVLPLLALAGVVLMVIGAALSIQKSDSLAPGFLALLLFVPGYALTIPFAIETICRLCLTLKRIKTPLYPMIIGGISNSISRTGLAAAALTIALASTFGVDTMINSFRTSVDQWLTSTLQSDIYISAPGVQSTVPSNSISSVFLNQLGTENTDMEIAPARSANIDSTGGIVDTLAFTPHKRSKQGFMLLAEKDENYWQSILNKDAILVSEPLAYRLQLNVGDKMQLFTDTAGFMPFEVVGIYRDYGSSHGRLAMRLSLYQKFWVDREVSSVAINLGSSSVQAAIDELRSLAASVEQQLMIQSNRSIQQRSLVVFDQTFQVTRVLRLLTIGVAFIGILSALLALQLERTRELATLRALGLTPNQSAGLIFGQSLSLGVMSGLLAIPLGLMMGDILIDVINLRSFGWTMAQDLRSSTVIETVVIATAAAAIAALYPVWKQYSLPVIRELHSE